METGRGGRLSAVFAALASDVRRDILDRLAREPMGVRELSGHYDMSVAAISKHLGVLEDAGLIARRVEGRRHTVSVRTDVLASATDYLTGKQEFWSKRLLALRALAARGTGHR